MARFLSYHEIEKGLIPTKETLAEIASDFMQFNEFQSGGAVVFGSVAWGEHTWRSDIDVADFSNCSWRSGIPMRIFDYFRDRHGSDSSLYVKNHMVEIIGNQNSRKGKWQIAHYQLPEISPSTRDHFILLARMKGGPWQTFLEKLKTIRCRSRKTDILEYLETMESNWASFHVFRKEILERPHAYGCLWNEFKTLQSIENFPKQLLRKILGKKKRLPSPDTVSCIKTAFAQLDDSWVSELRTHFQPFFEIDVKYNQLVHSVVGTTGLTCSGNEYVRHVYGLFDRLPVLQVIEAVRKVYPEC